MMSPQIIIYGSFHTIAVFWMKKNSEGLLLISPAEMENDIYNTDNEGSND